jgi:hypothetical protein
VVSSTAIQGMKPLPIFVASLRDTLVAEHCMFGGAAHDHGSGAIRFFVACSNA